MTESRVRVALSALSGRDRFARTRARFPDDRWIASYPRSGNTWVRFLLANLLQPERPVGLGDLESLVPDVGVHSERTLRALPRPRLLKTHAPYDPALRRVLHLVRDPRDVAVSFHRYQRKKRLLADDMSLDAFVAAWVAEPGDLGTWREHTGGWLGARAGTPGFLCVRYEDLCAAPAATLTRIAAHLDVACTDARAQAAVERSSAAELRRLEAADPDAWVALRGTRRDEPFFGPAVPGTWRTALSAEAAGRIETAFAPVMRELGYLDGGTR